MLPLGLCSLELRNIIECAFLPQHCTCTSHDNGTLSVEVSDPHTGAVSLVKSGIAADRLQSSRAISQLIAEMRTELAHTAQTHEQPAWLHARAS